MASASAQSRANALNQKIESAAGVMLEDLERNWLRKVARESFACAVKCYDKAGSSGPQEALEQCARNCQIPYQQSTALVQNVRLMPCSTASDPNPSAQHDSLLLFSAASLPYLFIHSI